MATTAAGSAHTSAVTTYTWIATGWNIHHLYDRDAKLTRHFFNTPRSYGTGTARTASPVKDGMAATPVLWYASYKKFASDIQSGAITFPYQWVMYDPEYSKRTPSAEQRDPGTYMREFAQLAHAHRLKVIESPARDLGLAPGAVCPPGKGETLNKWYLRCKIPGLAAADGDAVIVQDEANQRNPAVYKSLFNTAKQQVLAANASIPVIAAVSTNRGPANTMIAAAQSVAASGYYVTIRDHEHVQAVNFFTAMKSAGY